MSFQEYKRRSLLPLAGLALGAYYLFVFVPLGGWSTHLEQPLQESWRKLANSLGRTNASFLDFRSLTNQVAETRQNLAQLEQAKRNILARLAVAPLLRAKLGAPFQLVDFENERSRKMDELALQARQGQVNLEPALFLGYPEHTADLKEPALLWAALTLTDDLLQTALRCKVSAIHSLEVPLEVPQEPANPSTAPGPAPLLENSNRCCSEVPLQVEFTAPAASALKLLQSLPLHSQELRAAGLPEAPGQKSLLFIERLILRKQSPDKLDEVRVWMRVIGYIPRD